MRIPTFILLALCFSLQVAAKVQLPSIFTDNMVLQQQSAVRLWGFAKPNARLSIVGSWDKKAYILQVPASGKWNLKILTPKAGGPYTLGFNDGSLLSLHNILIGEVWLCSGQSNMEMALRGNSSPILNASEIILNADNPSLRLYRVSRAATLAPTAELKGQWMESTSATARDFSALAFQYGQILQKKLKVPVGIILSSTGGTMIEAWMSKNSLNAFPEVKVPESLDPAQAVHKEPTVLYNGMIAPLLGYGIKGFLWLQGESNRHEPELYEKLFPAMVADWRKNWGLGDIPFYYIQIAPYGGTDKTRSGPRLREAQLNAAKIIPNSGMVSALDVGMETDIHFMDKTTLAQRSAYWALGKTYGIKGIGYQSPELKSMEIKGDTAVLTFNYAPYLTSYRKPLTLFEIAGEDKKFYPAKAMIKANQVNVSSQDVARPVAVRYAYKEWVKAELFNNDGLPASSFRTDNW
ncbi:sialate O-acetylesterase [Pedobacter heparinus]|uniref:Sialate O-acetylesterase n=1 Tax=Pedobacter heparinus (strain ATCC 13125 / DSM 2366 / CIP 104194 / JCM 7457 / NBRC 12017 / NCIMB 9290 / NRRL B-14731 / HIM 762-3) TaxID=485917 RepID=C6XSG1_PEDHD|nr:sialate O-acetylesterase [Pedobacter heparinus]ACU03506.1 Sialate O-acetylesterase [Pedobacter heparinus DSM 2366]